MPSNLRSRTLTSLAPVLAATALQRLVAHLYSSVPPSPVPPSFPPPLPSPAPIKLVLSGTPTTLYGTPTVTVPTPSEPGALLLFSTIFVGWFLFLSILVAIPCALLSQRHLTTRLQVPSTKQIICAVLSMALLHYFPILHDFSIEDIYLFISHTLNLLFYGNDNLPEAGGLGEAYAKVMIVLEKRVDGSLWMVSFKQPTDTGHAYLEKDLTPNTQNSTTKHLDMTDIKSRFPYARDFIPSAPWRVLGIHGSPAKAAPSAWVPWIWELIRGNRLTMSRLTQKSALEFFSYARGVPKGTHSSSFNYSSAHAQVMAWGLIEEKSHCDHYGAPTFWRRKFYDWFGMAPYIDDLKLWIDDDEEEDKRRSEEEKKARHEKHLRELQAMEESMIRIEEAVDKTIRDGVRLRRQWDEERKKTPPGSHEQIINISSGHRS